MAPIILLAEVAGAVSRRTGEERRGLDAVRYIMELEGISLANLESELAVRSAEVAAQLFIRGTDATYVALAQAVGLPLVTWDGEQRERGAASIDVRTPSELMGGG